MNESNFEQLLILLNRQTDLRENLNDELAKANAMAEVTLSENFLEFPDSTIHSYLWALSDTMKKTKVLSEQLLEIMLKNIPPILA